MKEFLRAGILLLLGGGSCAIPPAEFEVPADVETAPFWRALARGDGPSARAAAEQIGWGARRSVEGERLRQAVLLPEGRRADLVRQIQEWKKQASETPSLLYLEARLLQQPRRQEARFRELVRQWPSHAWIQLGSAGLSQSEGRWSEARRHLAAAPDWPDARGFRSLLQARQWAHEGKVDAALELLEERAFGAGQGDALQEIEALGRQYDRPLAAARARAEEDLEAVTPDLGAAARIDRVAARLLADIRAHRIAGMKALLERLDAWSERAGLPAGWKNHPRYTLPLVGSLVRPEAGSGGPAADWLKEGRMLLAGVTLVAGPDLLLLRDVRHAEVPWPGQESPLELVLAGSAEASRSNRIAGGAIFRGFYLRLDLLRESALALQRSAARVDWKSPISLPDTPGGSRGLPEDYDLPLRLRARLLAAKGADPLGLEIEQTLHHEAGHLPDVLSILPEGPGVLKVVGLALHSLLVEDVLAWIEYRAELRGLAATPRPGWMLADIVERAREDSGTYGKAYARLLGDLLRESRSRKLPPLALWDRLDPATLTGLAVAVCRAKRINLLPREGVLALRSALKELLSEAALSGKP
ncbi:MAG: hypothetical protein ACE5H3_07710, partial [Planctomycetota bacterium]